MARRETIYFLTGDRADYDILYPIVAAAVASDDFAAGLIVAGSHSAPRYGASVEEIRRDGFPIVATIDTLLGADHPTARAKSAAIELASLADILRNAPPDLLCVMGDREDALVGALAGLYARLPVVHVGGGDRGDNAHPDNPVRDAVTKLAHIHLTTTPQSAARVRSLGEAAWRVRAIGASGLDRLASTPALTRRELMARLGAPDDAGPYLLVMQHSMPPEAERAGAQMAETLAAVAEIGLTAFVGRPNADPGGAAIFAEIERAAAADPRIRPFRNLSRLEFVNLFRHAACLIGNSSAGLIETPFLRLPAVDVGRRQAGREHAANVVHVDHDRVAIAAAIRRCLGDGNFRAVVSTCENPYGDGRSGPRAIEAIRERIADRARLLHKEPDGDGSDPAP